MDVSEVIPRLYVASGFYPPSLQDRIDWAHSVIFDLAHVIPRRFPAPEGSKVIEMFFLDGPDVPATLQAMAAGGAAAIERGQSVVCLCDAGRNRSALLAGAILEHLGYAPEQSVELVQRARASVLGTSGGALTNAVFRDWLLSHHG